MRYAVWSWLFLLTAGIGAWAAYDQVVALERVAWLVAGVVAVFVFDWLGRVNAERTLLWGGIGCAALAAGLGTLVLLPVPSFALIREDAIAAALIILLPLGSGALLWLWARHAWWGAAGMGLALSWALAMLLLTGERSAWFALVAATVTGWLVGQRFVWTRQRKRVWPLDLLLISGLTLCLVIYALAIAMPSLLPWLPLDASWTVSEHLATWRDALVLIQDYPFTGSGLGVTGLVYSTYMLLLHVPFQTHVHNLWLQVAVEQGIPGLLTLLGMAVTAVTVLVASWRSGRREEDALRITSFIALAAMLYHGLVDSELYASPLVPLLFLPFGFVLVAARLDQYVIDDFRLKRSKHTKGWVVGSIVMVSVIGVLCTVLWLALLPATHAAFQANLGAVAQSQIELSAYATKQWAIQDEVRRSPLISLESAIARYEKALRLDANNVTALRRLGQIALSQGNYEAARHYLESAHAHAPHQRTNHRLLGEALTVSGNIEQGVAIWNEAAIDANWLNQRHWWYTHIGATEQAAQIAAAMARVAHQIEASP